MSRLCLLFLKNAMLMATVGLGLIGVGFLSWVNYSAFAGTPVEALPGNLLILDLLIDIGALFFISFILVCYEKPIRRFLDCHAIGKDIPEPARLLAQKRLLNEPFFIVALSLTLWLIGAIVYYHYMARLGTNGIIIRLNLIDALFTVIMSLVVLAVFLISLLQWAYAPIFFPRGGLHDVPGVFRVSLRFRIVTFLFVFNIIPLATLMRTRYRIRFSGWSIEEQYAFISKAIWFICPLFIIIGVILAWMITQNISKVVDNLIHVLKKVTVGRLDGWVKVTTNDELGYVGDVVNEMTAGLRERDRMRHSIELASELQQSLIPKADPRIPGLDVAGKCVYSERTGGDYYDYLYTRSPGNDRLSVVVGDVSDHGIQAALLMASARALVRQRFSMGGGIDRIVTGVNRQISADVEESGQFMTLFMTDINTGEKSISWVNAGHDQAVLYNTRTGRLEPLPGRGPALGILPDFEYSAHRRNLTSGQVLAMGTDGIWEARNKQGEMFGKDNFFQLIMEQAHRPARNIVDNILKELDNFTHSTLNDDVTLVVIKVL